MILKIFSQLTTMQRSLISGFAAFVAYGSWAYWANSAHGMDAALKAGWLQGSYSFILTFCMTIIIDVVYQTLARMFSGPNKLHRWATIVIVCTFVFSISWWINAVAGTPEIFRTVVLGYVVGGVYTILYVFGLDYSVEEY